MLISKQNRSYISPSFSADEGSGFILKVTEILFSSDKRVKIVVEMPDPDRFTTKEAPHIPRILFRLLPHLRRHRCDNDYGFSFRQECACTEIPHLFEHLIIELQNQVQKSGPLKGETHWDWHRDPKGRFHVWVEYDNELLVLGAIRVAERFINLLDAHALDNLNVQEEIANLKRLARIGYELYKVSDKLLAGNSQNELSVSEQFL